MTETAQTATEPFELPHPSNDPQDGESQATAAPSPRERPTQFDGNPRAYADLPFGHTCGQRWSGSNVAHCAKCHTTFSGVSTFDAHRPDGDCVHPLFVGLTLVPGRAYECWGTTSDKTEPA